MRIKEFSIRRYGPLPDTGCVALDNFSLVFGKNEDGKTLTLDALVKLLLRRGRQLFNNIDRVDEDPEGYLIIEDDNGRQVKLPGKGDLTAITDLSPQECRNVFIIRNSDLSIASESEFYRNVTDRLTGLRTQMILSIRSQLQEIGKLTRCDSAASLRDVQGEKLKTRVETARALIEDIERLGRNVKEGELDRLEEDLLNLKEKEGETSQEIETLEDARKREKYQQGLKAYEELVSAQQTLEKLEVYTTEEASLWFEWERDISGWNKDAEGLQNKAINSKGELKGKEEALAAKRSDLEVLSERKRRIDDEIEPEIKNYLMGVGEAKRGETRRRFFTVAAIISAVLLSISIVGLMVKHSPVFYGLMASFLISTGIFAALKFSFTREKARLAAVFERIKLATSRFGVAAENIEEILANIQKFNEEYDRRRTETGQDMTDVSVLRSVIKGITETDIATIEGKIRIATEKIQNLSQKTGVGTLREYNEKLKLKLVSAQSVETQSKILNSHFGSKGEELQENLSYWQDEIGALREFEGKAKDITYDEKSVSGLKDEREELLWQERELATKMASFHEQLKEIERKANNLKLEDDYLHCNTSVDMKAITAKLSDFIAEIEGRKSNALEAMRIFEAIQEEEEGKISSLFGKDSSVSHHFCHITDGIYQCVEFIPEAKEIQVRLQNDTILSADKLSGGAYDQLYLSIRLVLGEKLLKGSKGFFVLDDPFIKADEERLERQLRILKRISESGWQIIYFTAKDEVRKLLEQDIATGKVHYVAIQGIFTK